MLPLYLRGLGLPDFVAEKIPEYAYRNKSGLSAIGERGGRGVAISVLLGENPTFQRHISTSSKAGSFSDLIRNITFLLISFICPLLLRDRDISSVDSTL